MYTHEMEVCSTVTTKKLSRLAKLILFTIQKVSDASRHKLLTTLDPQLLAKRGKTLRKSLNDAVSTSHSRITCRRAVLPTTKTSNLPSSHLSRSSWTTSSAAAAPHRDVPTPQTPPDDAAGLANRLSTNANAKRMSGTTLSPRSEIPPGNDTWQPPCFLT
ncbi:hypothetical protein Bca4012_080795 [Brassica carinata]